MYGMFGYAMKLNVQNSVSWMRNCAHNMCGMSGFARKIEYPELNSTGNCVHYMYGMSRLAKKLNC